MPALLTEKPQVQSTNRENKDSTLEVTLLTGGEDKPYALGLGEALAMQGIRVDFIGSDEIDGPSLHTTPFINFLNLRGNQSRNASFWTKAFRVLRFYAKLLRYAATAKPKVFHILWHNPFEVFDRVVLMRYYKLCGKKIAFTAHNVNARKRDGNDTWLNRFSLRAQYRAADHIFVHTQRMKQELRADFAVAEDKISVIPFGINNTLPNTAMTCAQARQALGLESRHKVLLFFGNVAPYKGLEYLVGAFARIATDDENYRLVITGSVKNCPEYWSAIERSADFASVRTKVLSQIGFIPDSEAEKYFKAADVLVLPYSHIFQSGVLFLGYSFGLPVIATDVGSLREDIVEGSTGYVCDRCNDEDLTKALRKYFASDLFRDLSTHREAIRTYANDRYSWTRVGEITKGIYARLSDQPEGN